MGGVEAEFVNPSFNPFACTTPSRHEILRQCRLRAAYTSDRAAGRLRAGFSPAALFGNVCHAVLEDAARGELDVVEDDFAALFESRWGTHLKEALFDSVGTESISPSPARWPGYALKKVKVRRLAEELVSRRMRNPELVLEPEHDLVAADGRLRGRADLIIKEQGVLRVEDYKSGSIYESDEAGSPSVKAAYRRQMLLYAALCQAEYSEWPASATLVPLEGPREDVVVEPKEALSLVSAAVDILTSYNEACSPETDSLSMGSPSPDACRFCPFAVVCPAFWSAIDVSWGAAGVLAVGGRVTSVFVSRFGTLELDVHSETGSSEEQTVSIHGLHPSSFGMNGTPREGDSIRLSGMKMQRETWTGTGNSRGVVVRA